MYYWDDDLHISLFRMKKANKYKPPDPSWICMRVFVFCQGRRKYEQKNSLIPPSSKVMGSTYLLTVPDSTVYGANMGPIWGRQDTGGPHVGPMNLVTWGRVYGVNLKQQQVPSRQTPPCCRDIVATKLLHEPMLIYYQLRLVSFNTISQEVARLSIIKIRLTITYRTISFRSPRWQWVKKRVTFRE